MTPTRIRPGRALVPGFVKVREGRVLSANVRDARNSVAGYLSLFESKGSLCKVTRACARASAISGLKRAKFSLGLLPGFLFLFTDHLFNMPEIAENDKIIKPILLDF